MYVACVFSLCAYFAKGLLWGPEVLDTVYNQLLNQDRTGMRGCMHAGMRFARVLQARSRLYCAEQLAIQSSKIVLTSGLLRCVQGSLASS